MIPADHITFNDDGTAWLVHEGNDTTHAPANLMVLDRPCDTCTDGACPECGRLRDHDPDIFHGCAFCGDGPCPDCIDGRHTFEIEVECGCTVAGGPGHEFPQCIFSGSVTHRVSVVPGGVLPIDETGIWPGRHSVINRGVDGEFWWLKKGELNERVRLPPIARPGMFAVKVKVSV